MGTKTRERIIASGLPGHTFSCRTIIEEEKCSLSVRKEVHFSSMNIKVKEGMPGYKMTVKLLAEPNITAFNKSELSTDEIREFRGVHFRVNP